MKQNLWRKLQFAQFISSRALMFLGAFFVSTSILANPVLQNVEHGNVSVTQTNTTTTINQTSSQAILNWQSFNINSNEHTHFNQPDGGVALNRISATQGPSQIYGHLSATGRIILINTAGVFFGPSAFVNVGGLIASTANISNADFLSGNFRFNQISPNAGMIINKGTIIAAQHGLVALLANGVQNDGTISATLGKVAIGSGNSFTLSFAGNDMIGFSVDSGSVNGISHTGTISANGGQVLMTAKAASNVLDQVINLDGIVEAKAVELHQGEIILSSDIERGLVKVNNTLDVSGKNAGEHGGDITITGKHILLDNNALLDASGDIGGGNVFVGGNYQGLGPLPNATAVAMFSGARINADALTNGNGGNVILWADDVTKAYGSISAKGGIGSGNGGLIETSGKNYLDVSGIRIDTRANNGLHGTWLLDPTDLTISSGTTADVTASGSPTDTFLANNEANTSILKISDLTDALLNSNVIVQTTSGGGGTGSGNITVSEAVSWATTYVLTLSAVGNIAINAAITAASGGLALVAASVSSTAAGTIQVGTPGLSVDVSTGTSTLTGVISGSNAALTKLGAGTLALAGSNTYTGDTIISAGTLQLAASNRISNSSTVAIASGATFDLNNFSDEVGGISDSGGAGGNVTLGSGTITLRPGDESFSGVISGTGQVVKNGGGAQSLLGDNTFSGGIRVNDGTLRFDSDAGFGAIPASFDADNIWIATGGNNSYFHLLADFEINANRGITLNNQPGSSNLWINPNGNTVTYNGKFTSTNGAFAASGSGTFIVGGDSSATFTGGLVTLDTSTLQVTNSNALGGATLRFRNGTLQAGTTGIVLPNTMTIDSTAKISGSNDLTLSGNLALSGTETFNISSVNVTASGVISGTDGLTKSGTGTLTLSGVNTFSGATNVTGGTLSIGAANNISSTSGITLNNGTLLTTATLTLDDNIALGASGGTITNNSGILTLNGTLTGSGALTLGGTGTSIALNGNIGASTTSIGSFIGGIDLNPATGLDMYFSDFSLSNNASWVQNGALGTMSVSGNFDIASGDFLRVSGGNGDINGTGAYQIEDVFGLQGIGSNSTYLAADWIMTQDINASTASSWNSAAGFDPIGTLTGNFDGDNYTISNLTINRSGESSVGLFSQTSSLAEIKDLTLSTIDIDGGQHTGGLVGLNAGTVNNVVISGTNTVDGSTRVGGLVGENTGTINNSTVNSAVTGTANYTGGFAGFNSGNMTDVAANGLVTGTGYVGGLIGIHVSGTITNGTSTGNVIGAGNYVGGFMGENRSTIAGTSSVNGNVNNNTSKVGGFLGYNKSTGSLEGTINVTGNVTSTAHGETAAFIGRNDGDIDGNLVDINITPTNVITGHGYWIGGFIGSNVNATVQNFTSSTLSGEFTLTSVVTATGNQSHGGFIGLNQGGTINNVVANVDITGNNQVGGLVGYNLNTANTASISNAFSTGTVSGASHVGGLVGQSADGATINTSYSSSAVTGNTNVGGLVGNNAGSITDSYALGSATANSGIAGGLVGLNNSTGSITRTYSTATVTGNTAGGLVGSEGGGTLSGNFWDIVTSGISDLTAGCGNSASCAGVTAGQLGSGSGVDLTLRTTYTDAGWSYDADGLSTANITDYSSRSSTKPDDAWFIFNGETRPLLLMEHSTTVTNSHQLQLMGSTLGTGGDTVTYTLASDINLSATQDGSDIWGSNGFVPIGTGASYTGSLIGQNYSISNLYINRSNTSNQALFSNAGGGDINNITLINPTVTGKNQTGAFVGWYRGRADNLSVINGNITGFDQVGGIAGFLQTGGAYINNAYVSGSLSGRSQIGGIVGLENFGSKIRYSYNTATVTGTGGDVGGILGRLGHGYLTNNYNAGAVSTGTGYAGGIIGYITNVNQSTDSLGNVWDTVSSNQAEGFGLNDGIRTIQAFGGCFGATTACATQPGTNSSNVGAALDLSLIDTYTTTAGWSATAGEDGSITNVVSTTATAPNYDWFIFEGETRPIMLREYSTDISNAHQLQLSSTTTGTTYTISGDLDLSSAASASEVWGGSQPISATNVNGSAYNIALGGATLSLSNDSDTTMSGNISGTGGFSKAGSGTLTLSGTNTYSGTTGVHGGTMIIAEADSINPTALSLDGGTLILGSPYTFTGGVTLGAGGGTITNNSGILQLDGAIDGAGALTLNGSGSAYILNGVIGSNTAITALTVSLPVTLGGGAITADGNTITFNNAVTLGANTVITDSGDIIYNSTIDGAYALTNTSSGGDVTYTGNIGSDTALTSLTTNASANVNIPVGIDITVGDFILSGGSWNQNGALGEMNITGNFDISGGDFLRVAGGDGDKNSVDGAYQIEDVYGLQGMASAAYLTADWILTKDIDASSSVNWNSGQGWNTIGDRSSRFQGTLDGQNHTISDLFINRTPRDQALFGATGSSAVISNLRLLSFDITGGEAVGSLAGQGFGTMNNITVENVNISGVNYVGGLVGTVAFASADNIYVSGSVSGTRYVGGIAGGASFNSGIRYSYNTASITASNTDVGGIIGRIDNGYLENNYNSGSVTGPTNAGGVIGYINTTANQNNAGNIWDTVTSGQAQGYGANDGSGSITNMIGGCLGATTTCSIQPGTNSSNPGDAKDLSLLATYTDAGWSSTASTDGNITATPQTIATQSDYKWIIFDGHTRPMLMSDHVTTITTAEELQLAGAVTDADYLLANDVNMSATEDGSGIWTSKGFAPIGISHSNNTPYTGEFDGQGYAIDSLYINTSANGAGLFAKVEGATISDLSITNAEIITSNSISGILAGNAAQNNTITNIFTSGSITSTGTNNTGGMIGHSGNNNTFSGLVNTASVNGNERVGGLIGIASGGTASSLTNSYNLGSVSGNDAVGGLIGYVNAPSTISVTDSYSAGSISGTTNIGGLVGSADGTLNVTNAFWDITTSGLENIDDSAGSSGAAGYRGMTTSEMMTTSNFDTAGTFISGTPWDIGTDHTSNTWVMIDGITRPVLASEIYNSGTTSLNTNISTVDQLNLIGLNATTLAGDYKLVNDLDLSLYASTTNGFKPIGDADFTGTFDGQNFSIIDLVINRPTTTNVGLFRTLSSTSTVKNVNLTTTGAAKVDGQTNVGSVAGQSWGVIENVSSNVPLIFSTGDTQRLAGGLVGQIRDGGSIVDSNYTGDISWTATVTSNQFVGGLIGYTPDSASIDNSYSTGTIKYLAPVTGGSQIVGGLVGYINNISGTQFTINDSYSTSTIQSLLSDGAGFEATSGAYNIGGLIGQARETNITNSYSNGQMTLEGNSTTRALQVGGLVGAGAKELSITDSHSNTDINLTFGEVTTDSNHRIGGIMGNYYETTDSLILNNLYNTGDITIQLTDVTGAAARSVSIGGIVGQLEEVSSTTASNLSNEGDINFTVTNQATNQLYAGGIFGYGRAGSTVDAAVNLGAITVDVGTATQSIHVGGIVGRYENSAMTNAYNLGAINVTGSYNTNTGKVGGIVGVINNTASIDNAYNAGSVTAPDNILVGAIAGENAGGSTTNVNDVFWDSDVSGVSVAVEAGSSNGIKAGCFTGSGCTSGTANLSDITTYTNAGWDVGTDHTSNTWVTFDDQTRPMLAMEYDTTIRTANQLQLIGLNDTSLAADYTLANNLDLTATKDATGVWGSGGFVPIGQWSSGNRFTGSLNGNNYTLDNLYIRKNDNGVGLFSSMVGASISNLRLTNVDIINNGPYNTAALAGVVNSSDNIISNVHVLSGSISGTATHGGAFVGTNYFGQLTISNSYNAASIASGWDTGGLIGIIEGGSSNVSINNSYNLGAVTTNSDGGAGGIVASNNGTVNITNIYNSGRIQNNNPGVAGGIIGWNSGTINVTNSFWNSDTSNTSISVGSTSAAGYRSMTTTELSSHDNLTNSANGFVTGNGWNDNGSTITSTPSTTSTAPTETWFIFDGATTPLLMNEHSTTITNAHQLQLAGTTLDADYTLANDIDLSATQDGSDVWGSAGFASIGNGSNPFTGSLDANDNTISNLYINRSVEGTALIGRASNATVENLTLSNVNIINNDSFHTAAVIGMGPGNTFRNLNLSGTITVEGSANGFNNGGVIGLVYGTDTTTLDNISSSLVISARHDFVGGLIGVVGSNSTVNISNAFVNGYISSGNGGSLGMAAGLVSSADANSTVNISDSISIATTAGTNARGLVGRSLGTVNVDNTFWDTDKSGQNIGLGSITSGTLTNVQGGCLTGTCTNGGSANLSSNSLYVAAGWDMADTWNIVDGVSYPYLKRDYTTGATPRLVVGTATGASSGSRLSVLANGSVLGSTVLSADGSFYFLADNGAIVNDAPFAVYFDDASVIGTAVAVAPGSDGHITSSFGLNVETDKVKVGATDASTVNISQFATLSGSVSDVDLLFSGSSNTVTVANATNTDVTFETAANVTMPLNGTIEGHTSSNASITLNGIHAVSADSTVRSAGTGDVTINSALNWGGVHTLTLNAGRNINLNNSITAASGTLSLAAADSAQSITTDADGTINVANFELTQGQWYQLGTLPAFAAENNFAITFGAEFLRATGGEGTSDAPYLITDIYGLQGIGSSTNLLSKSFNLTTYIDASIAASWNNSEGWSPIGSGSNRFVGYFDGSNNTISNLTINRPASNNTGLFGYIQESTIQNLIIENATIDGNTGTGALVGTIANTANTRISNISISGTITGHHASNNRLGSVAGNVFGTSGDPTSIIIDNVHSTANVNPGITTTGYTTTGGLLGLLSNATLSNSSFTGTINELNKLGDATGGLVGWVQNNSIISNSHANATVYGANHVGGLVGFQGWNSTIRDSYSNSTVIASNEFAGGIIGMNAVNSIVERSYSTGTVKGVNHVGGIAGNNRGSTIDQSYSSADVTASGTYAGGIAGMHEANTDNDNAYITNSYATGIVIGNDYVGGIAGQMQNTNLSSASKAYIDDSYSTALVINNGGTDNVGGVVGNSNEDTTITNTFWDTATSLQSSGIGVGTGTDTTIGGCFTGTNCAYGGTANLSDITTFSNAGWDITATPSTTASAPNNKWFMFDGATRPMLMMENTTTIKNAHELQMMGATLDADYTLANDIDLRAAMHNERDVWGTNRADSVGSGFVPIGISYADSPFTGSFDGQNNVIDNLYMNRNTRAVALFSTTAGNATISNINLLNVNITNNVTETAGLIGSAVDTSISNVTVTGTITSTANNHLGGILGAIGSGVVTIDNAYNGANLISTTTNRVGGIVGYISGFATDVDINNSYNTGNISGNADVGGLIGRINEPNTTITNSYSSGHVSGNSNLGGLIGAGVTTLFSVINSFWDTDTSMQNTSFNSTGAAGYRGMTSAQLMNKDNLTLSANGFVTGSGWSISNAPSTNATAPTETWFVFDGATRPMLMSEYATNLKTAHQVQLAGTALGADYTLARDIDMSATQGNSDVWAASGFVPIAVNDYNGIAFSGTFDGQNNAIKNLYINRGLRGTALFAQANNASISNLLLLDVDITNNNGRTAALLATVSGATIDNVTITGRVEAGAGGENYHLGSIIGFISSGTVNISNVNNSASIYGTIINRVGGLVGSIGFVDSVNISNSYNTGSITGNDGVGGMIGQNFNSSQTALTNTYSSGLITGNSNTGGLIGRTNGTPVVTNSFWDTQSSGQSTSAGSTGAAGYRGMTSAEMSNPTNFTTNTAFVTGNGWNDNSLGVVSQSDGVDAPSGTWFIDTSASARPMLVSEYNTTIRTPHQLQLMSTAKGADYTLANDIDLSATASTSEDVWSTSAGWQSIGIYTGVFDGNHYSIYDPYIDVNSGFAGLFAETNAAVVKNVNLVGTGTGLISGVNGTGSLVGVPRGSAIINVSSSIPVRIDEDFSGGVGGLFGATTDYNSTTYSNIIDAHYSGDIDITISSTNNNNIGGLSGYSRLSNFFNSSTSGSIIFKAPITTGSLQVGGLLGNMNGDRIENSFSTTNILHKFADGGGLNLTDNKNARFGGLVGTVVDYSGVSPIITNSYSAGSIDLESTDFSGWHRIGGLVGYAGALGLQVTNSHSNTPINIYMQNAGNAANRIFGGVIGSLEGGDKNYLIDNVYNTGNITILVDDSTGTGNRIYRVGGVAGYMHHSGTNTISNAFNSGDIDITINGTNYSALQIGGVVGNISGPDVNTTQLLNVGNSGNITVTLANHICCNQDIGGILGQGYVGLMSNVYNTGNILLDATSAGIADIGGIVGLYQSRTYTVNNAFNSGNVIATGSFENAEARVGGLIGMNQNGSTSFSKMINIGYVSGVSNGYTGAVVGWRNGTTNISDAYWDSNTVGLANSTGTGNTSGMTAGSFDGSSGANLSAQATYSGFTFDASNWSILEGASYPYLSSFFSSTPRVIKGNTPAAADSVIQLASNGSLIDKTKTYADGSYYFLTGDIAYSPVNTSVADSSNLLVYLDDAATEGNAVNIAPSSNGSLINLDISGANTISYYDDGGSTPAARLSAAKGSLTDDDILFSVSGSTITVNSPYSFELVANFARNFSDTITGSGNFIKSGASDVSISAAQTYTGDTTINDGVLSLIGSATLNGGNYAGNVYMYGENLSTTFIYNSSNDQVFSGIVRGNNTKLNLVSASTLTLSGTEDNHSLGVIVDNGTLNLAKTSAGNVHAIGGPGLILNGGTVQYTGTGNDQIYNGGVLTVNDGTLDLNGWSDQINVLAGNGGIITNGATATTSTLTIGGNGTSSYAGIIQDGAGQVALTINNTGTQTLTGANTYSGQTNILNSELIIGNGSSAATLGSSDITINDGAALRINHGSSVSGNITASGTGADSQGVIKGSGTATLSGNVTIAADSTFGTFSSTDVLILNGSVNGAHAMTLAGSGTVKLAGNVGNSTAPTTLTADSKVEIASNITTEGDQLYNNTVTNSGNHTLSINGGANAGFHFNAAINGGGTLNLIGAGAASKYKLAANTGGAQTWNFTELNGGTLAGGAINQTINFSNLRDITGGVGDDTFVFIGNGRSNGFMDAGPQTAVNTIDLTQYNQEAALSLWNLNTFRGQLRNAGNGALIANFVDINNIVNNPGFSNAAITFPDNKFLNLRITGALRGEIADPLYFTNFGTFNAGSGAGARVVISGEATFNPNNMTVTINGVTMTFNGFLESQFSGVNLTNTNDIATVVQQPPTNADQNTGGSSSDASSGTGSGSLGDDGSGGAVLENADGSETTIIDESGDTGASGSSDTTDDSDADGSSEETEEPSSSQTSAPTTGDAGGDSGSGSGGDANDFFGDETPTASESSGGYCSAG